MEKYMGNKSKLLDFIYGNVEKELRPDDEKSLFDAFTGTTNVGKYFKKNGYDVAVNDINDFSYVLGKCYVDCKKIPKFKKLINSKTYFSDNYNKICGTKSFDNNMDKLIRENKNTVNNDYMKDNKDSNYFKIINYLTYYSTPADYDNLEDKNPIDSINFLQKNYCEFGENTKYINLVYKKTLDSVIKDLEKNHNNKAIDYIYKFYEYPFEVKYLNKAFECVDKKTEGYKKNQVCARKK